VGFGRYISREEFLGQAAKPVDETAAKAERAFHVMDRNNDGFVTKAEMLKMTKHLTKAQVRLVWSTYMIHHVHAVDQVDAVFKRVDDNHDGKLTLAEFEEMMQHNKSGRDQVRTLHSRILCQCHCIFLRLGKLELDLLHHINQGDVQLSKEE